MTADPAQRLDIATGTLHWDGPEGLGQLFVIHGVVADLAIVLNGRIVYFETDWNVIEFYESLMLWTRDGRTADFLYGENVEGHESPPAFYRQDGDSWIVRSVRSVTGPLVTRAALDEAVDEFCRRVESDFEAFLGVGLADWMSTTGRPQPQ